MAFLKFRLGSVRSYGTSNRPMVRPITVGVLLGAFSHLAPLFLLFAATVGSTFLVVGEGSL
jgi:hypothetical protein